MVFERNILEKIINDINQLDLSHPIRVGIDGIDCSGKTTLADELRDFLQNEGFNVIRASIDGFHNQRDVRYRRGRESAEGYYQDSFNNQKILENLLKPLGLGGDLEYSEKIFDYRTNKKLDFEKKKANSSDVLIMDGVFLFRPELVDYFDYKIFLDVDFEEALNRAKIRDIDDFTTEDELIMMYEKRYFLGQRIYFEEAKPREQAHIII